MKFESFGATLLVLACTGMLLQPVAIAASQAPPITDVALQRGGVLVGQITSDQGQPLTGAPVSIIQQGKEIAQVSTDQQGAFKVAGLQGGVYQLTTVGQQGIYRLWAPQTAPPAAQQRVRMSASHLVRGQGESNTFSRFADWIKNHPLITGGVIAAAIAIPLAINNNDDGPSS